MIIPSPRLKDQAVRLANGLRLAIPGLLALTLAACSFGAPAATATLSPVVVSTVQGEGPAPTTAPLPVAATQTPLPPPTPLPTLTVPPAPTPAVTPTPDPNQGVGEVVYADRLDGVSGWGWGYAEPEAVTFSTAGGQLNAVMAKTNIGPRFTVSPDTIKVGAQQIRFVARTNLCYERDEYGLAFRTTGSDANGNPNGYVFKLNCAGQVRLETARDGQVTVLVDWTAYPAIVSGAPAENVVLIWAAAGEIRVYVNDKYLFSASDAAFAEGAYAFFLRDRTAGGQSVSFSGLEVRAVTP